MRVYSYYDLGKQIELFSFHSSERLLKGHLYMCTSSGSSQDCFMFPFLDGKFHSFGIFLEH